MSSYRIIPFIIIYSEQYSVSIITHQCLRTWINQASRYCSTAYGYVSFTTNINCIANWNRMWHMRDDMRNPICWLLQTSFILSSYVGQYVFTCGIYFMFLTFTSLSILYLISGSKIGRFCVCKQTCLSYFNKRLAKGSNSIQVQLKCERNTYSLVNWIKRNTTYPRVNIYRHSEHKSDKIFLVTYM